MADDFSSLKDQKQRARKKPRPGKLGAFVSGAFEVESLSDPAKYYVRFDDATFSQYLHKGRVRDDKNTNVQVGWDEDGDYCILGLQTAQAGAEVSHNPDVLIRRHTHVVADITDMNANVIPFDVLTPGDWDGTPLYVDDALEQLAERVTIAEAAIGGIVATGKYRQYIYAIIEGSPGFLADSDGHLITGLYDLE